MSSVSVAPGPAAARAFRLGVICAAALWVGAVGVAVWIGVVSPLAAGVALAVLFPAYLVVVAAVLSVWLGYDKDAAALRRVTVEQDGESRTRD